MTHKFTAVVVGVLLGTVISIAAEAKPSVIDGKWLWRGNAGWQRIELNLRSDGKVVKGTIKMGPGATISRKDAEDWEYFFAPATFPILNGRLDGNTITFDQKVVRAAGLKPDEELHYTGRLEDGRITLVRSSIQRYDVDRPAQPKANEICRPAGGIHVATDPDQPQNCPKDAFVLGDHRMAFTVVREGTTFQPGMTETSSAPSAIAERTTVFASVTDRDGKPVTGLSDHDFTLFADGGAVPIQNFHAAADPADVLLLFDHNQTWFEDSTTTRDSPEYGVPEWNELLSAARGFLGRLRPLDHIAIADFENITAPCFLHNREVPCRFHMALEWRTAKAQGSDSVSIGLSQPATAQKDLYDAVVRGIDKFKDTDLYDEVGRVADSVRGIHRRRIAVFFTDGRDGRLNPRWLRGPTLGSNVTVRGALPIIAGPRNMVSAMNQYDEVLDPLYGLPDAAERADFDKTVEDAEKSGVELYFIAINTGRDPEFGPALVGRRISGLFPGSNEAIDAYLADAKSNMERLAAVSGGHVFYGNTPQDAVTLYGSLYQNLGIGRYAFTVESAAASHLEIRPNNPELRIQMVKP